MGFKNREIERKYEIHGKASLEKVAQKISKWVDGRGVSELFGESDDIYFKPLKDVKVDFARVRMMPEGRAQMTVKYSDKKNDPNQDRVEIDVDVQDPAQAIAFCTQVFGLPIKSVRKQYAVFFLTEHTSISVYRVVNDKRMFMEIESDKLSTVANVENKLKNLINFKREKRSLYQIFCA